MDHRTLAWDFSHCPFLSPLAASDLGKKVNWKADYGFLWVWGQPSLHNEFQNSQGYMETLSPNNNKRLWIPQELWVSIFYTSSSSQRGRNIVNSITRQRKYLNQWTCAESENHVVHSFIAVLLLWVIVTLTVTLPDFDLKSLAYPSKLILK